MNGALKKIQGVQFTRKRLSLMEDALFFLNNDVKDTKDKGNLEKL